MRRFATLRPLHESLNDRPVGRQQRLSTKLRGRHPFERLGLEPGGLAAIVVDHEHSELDHTVGVIMPQLQQRMTAAQRYAELLGQFARQRLSRCSHRGRSYRPETPSTRPCACRAGAARSAPVRSRRAAPPRPRAARPHSLIAGQGAVAVLVLLARAARTGLVAADLAIGRARTAPPRLGCAARPWTASRRMTAARPARPPPARISGSPAPSSGCASACCACSACISRSRRSASSRSICSWVRISILRQRRHRVELHAIEHRREQLEGLALELVAVVLLRVAAQVNALAQVVHRRQMLAPVLVERAQHHVALDVAHDLGADALHFLRRSRRAPRR